MESAAPTYITPKTRAAIARYHAPATTALLRDYLAEHPNAHRPDAPLFPAVLLRAARPTGVRAETRTGERCPTAGDRLAGLSVAEAERGLSSTGASPAARDVLQGHYTGLRSCGLTGWPPLRAHPPYRRNSAEVSRAPTYLREPLHRCRATSPGDSPIHGPQGRARLRRSTTSGNTDDHAGQWPPWERWRRGRPTGRTSWPCGARDGMSSALRG